MKIILLELIGFKRLRLARLTRIVYRPQARQQLILGTNGSGKSSLLDELSPLPGHHSNFTSGGLKHIEIESGPHCYVLRSEFKSGNRHSFLKDGIELNEGGTYQVQLKLVRDEFRYTERLHDLLTGRLRFTDMRAQERREWITMLSEADWTYALSLYQQFKTKARDAQGAFKHAQARYVQETQNLNALNDTEELKVRFETLRSELNQLLMSIAPNVPQYNQLVQQIDSAYANVTSDSQRTLAQLPAYLFDGRYRGIADIEAALKDTQIQYEVDRVALERAGSDIAELDSILSSFGGQSLEAMEDLPSQLIVIESKMQTLAGQRYLWPVIESPGIVLEESQRIHPDLMNLMQSLPDNSTGRYSRARLQEAMDEKSTLQGFIDQTQSELNRFIDRLSHLKGQHESKCPRCELHWKEGVDPKEVESLEHRVTEFAERVASARQKVTELDNAIETIEAYGALWGRFRGFVTSYPRLKMFWDYLLEQNLITHHPAEKLHVIQLWINEVMMRAEYEALHQQYQKLDLVLEAQRQFGGAGKLQQKRHALETEIERLTPALRQHQQRLSELQTHRQTAIATLEQLNNIDQQLISLTSQLELAVTAIRNQLLDDQARERHIEMSAIQRQLTDRSTLAGIVQDLAHEGETLELQYKTFQHLSALISPTEGLIAERLREAIFSIVDQMNTIIASVWTHELRVLECGFENSDLDYKFPVSVESPDNVTSDISRCSKGQMEMINIAFKLTAMLYLDLLDYPLFMDEPGEGFDEQHRDQIMSLIRTMLDAGHYSQLFMVSHFASSHGAFLEAQILVLESSNIALPGTYNEHAILE